jgi:hypothetical protein
MYVNPIDKAYVWDRVMIMPTAGTYGVKKKLQKALALSSVSHTR